MAVQLFNTAATAKHHQSIQISHKGDLRLGGWAEVRDLVTRPPRTRVDVWSVGRSIGESGIWTRQIEWLLIGKARSLWEGSRYRQWVELGWGLNGEGSIESEMAWRCHVLS